MHSKRSGLFIASPDLINLISHELRPQGSQHLLKCFGAVNFHSLFIGFLDLEIYLLAVNGYLLGRADADLNLVTADIQYCHFNVIVNDK